jgi:hypothetical protein
LTHADNDERDVIPLSFLGEMRCNGALDCFGEPQGGRSSVRAHERASCRGRVTRKVT